MQERPFLPMPEGRGFTAENCVKTFKDSAGRTWVITISVYAVKRVRALCGVDLYGLVDEQLQGLGKLLTDPVGLVDVLYVLCKDEADKLGVSDEDFGRSLGGDSLEHATNAFLEELTDFFPEPRKRAGIRKVIEKSRQVAMILQDRAMEALENMDAQTVAQNWKPSAGSSPVSSGSILDHSPSGNSA